MATPIYNEIVIIGEHTYKKPKLPKNTKEILWYNESPENAFWRRLELPKVFYDFVPNYTELDAEATMQDTEGLYKSFSKEDSLLFIQTLQQELHRREHGIHFKNGNEIEYLTGDHYFLLQHAKCFGIVKKYKKFIEKFGKICDEKKFNKLYAEYGDFCKFQRDVFYLIDKVCKDSECLGGDFSKAKKTGITFCFMAGYILNKSTRLKNQQVGVMSKKKDDAIDTNMLYYFYGFDGLPNIFKPTTQKLSRAEGEVIFGTKSFGGTSANKLALNAAMKDKALNTRVFCAPTKPKGFDAPVMTDEILDEFNKMFAESHVSPKEVFDTSSATVKFQNDINGKIWIFGYVSEEEDAGVEEARVIYFNSKQSTKKEGKKRTESELLCHHISALNSYFSLIDKYGDCDEQEANRRIEETIESAKKDIKKKFALKRQLARNEQEAWEIGGAKSTYNPFYLTKRLYDIKREEKESGMPLGIGGRLEWENPLWEVGRKDRRPKGMFCPVKFIPHTEEDYADGLLPKYTFWNPIPKELQNYALKFGKDDYGRLNAPPFFLYSGGCDPTQYADSNDVEEPSMNSMYVKSIHDSLKNIRANKLITNVLAGDYYFRPENPHESYEDILKFIIFTGCLSLIEANAPYVANRLIEDGLINYMVVKSKETNLLTIGKSWMKLGEHFNLVKRTANQDQNELMEMMIRCNTNYISVIPDEPNYLDTIKDADLIEKHLLPFDPKLKTKKYDKHFGFGYCNIAHDIYVQSLLESQDDWNNVDNISSVLSALAK